MINVKTIVTDLNNIKNRAVKIAGDLFDLGVEESSKFNGKPHVPNDQEDFGWWGITKFLFNGSRRITQTIESINFVFDLMEEDIEEMKAVQKDGGITEYV